jgi:hypothetical protein
LCLSTLYCAPAPRATRSRKEHGGGLHPELAVFGFHEGQSAALTSLMARQATLMPSFEQARQELGRHGVKRNIKVVQRITHSVGEQLLIARRCDLQRYRAGQMPVGKELAGKRVSVQIDGGRIRLRKVTRKQQGKGKKKVQQRRYQGKWREPKLITIFEIDAHGKKVGKSRARIDGTFRGPDEVMELVAMYLHQLGAAQAEVVVFLSDGASWIWDRWDWVIKRVGLDSKKVAFALDWCHALHHVGLALAAVGLAAAEHSRVFKKLRKWLKEGEAAMVLNELERLGKEHGALEAMATPVAYLDKHLAAGHLKYATLQKRGLPIGSGAIESVIRRVVNQRLKGNGLMWCEGNAEGMLLLRAAALTERWDEAMERAQQSKCKDGQVDWDWSSPDMPFQLNAKIDIKPPVPQVLDKKEHRRISA